MLNADYDGRSLFARQVFFPMAGPKDGWAMLTKNLKTEIDEELETFEKCSISFKFKEDENCNRRNTLTYFEDYNLSLTPKLGERGRFAKVSTYRSLSGEGFPAV